MQAFEQVKVDDATREQLHRYVEMVLGVTDLSPRPTRDTLIAKMVEMGATPDAIPVLEDTPAPVPVTRGPSDPFMHDFNGRETMCQKIVVHTAPGKEGKAPVFVSVNGVSMLIPRGEAVTIPTEFVEALDNAVADVYDPEEDGGLGQPRPTHSYPFSYA